MLLRRALLLSTGVFSGLAFASGTTYVVTTSVESCSYESGSGGVAPTPIPTVKGNDSTVTTISTHAAVTVPSIITVIAPTSTVLTVTKTSFVPVTNTVTLPTSTIGSWVTETVATLVVAETVCADGAKPVTVTEYTGTYQPVSGQVTTLLATYPTQAFCSATSLISMDVFPTVTSGSVTQTFTPLTTPLLHASVTITKTAINGLITVYATTVTETITSYVPHVVKTTSTISCGETVTKTMAAQCAPSNLISAIDDEGLLAEGPAGRFGTIDINQDPSTCCQTCVDNEGCGAIMALDGDCALFYAIGDDAEPVCDALVYKYTSSSTEGAGQSVIVQSGCGKLEYIPLSQLEV